MTYFEGDSDTYPSAYGTYWPQSVGSSNQGTSRASQLLVVVVILGLATYFVSCGATSQAGGTGWAERFSTLAAIVAALGLLPRQSGRPPLVVGLAVMGFLEALSQLISGDQNPGWATILIVVLNTLQALTAIAALLAQLRMPGAADRGRDPYDAYAYYSQVAQQYYAANDQQRQSAQAQATAQEYAAATAQAQQSAAERTALYAEYLGTQQTSRNPAAASVQSGAHTQPAQPVAGFGMPTTDQTDGTRTRNDSAPGSPAQSSY